jgi:FkbM family methyltransferase
MNPLKTLSKSIRFAQTLGRNLQSKRVLMGLVLINSIDHRRKRCRWIVRKLMEIGSQRGRLHLTLTGAASSKIGIKAVLRTDPADYQSVYECLGFDHYKRPAFEVTHLLDGGANIGFFSLALLRTTDKCEIIAVEANPKNIEILRSNLPMALIRDCALSALDGVAEFDFCAANTGSLSEFSTFAPRLGSISVKCTRLSSLIPDSWNMDKTWLKLDIEGAEYSVIQDFLTTDSRRPKAISLEIHDYLRKGGELLVRTIENAGYCVSIEGSGNSGNVCRQIYAEYHAS